jgi:oligopeptide transport system substrate-binding protein
MTFADLWISNSGFAKFFGYYASSAYDEIFKKLDGESDINKRSELYAELEKQLVVNDAGIAPYMYGDARYFIQNYVKNISAPMFGPKYEFSRAYIQGRN